MSVGITFILDHHWRAFEAWRSVLRTVEVRR
jgi:hypothetical protein